MENNYKNINIGELVRQCAKEKQVNMQRICNFFKCPEVEIEEMYLVKSMDTEQLLKWSKLLEYDFFRLYSHHLILYAPQASDHRVENRKVVSSIPRFRKNVYTTEIIDFLLEQISSGSKTVTQLVKEYNIPKTTLYKWSQKYKK